MCIRDRSQPISGAQVTLPALDEPVIAAESVPTVVDKARDVAPVEPDDPAPVARTSWVCDGEARIEDPRARRWQIEQVRFEQRGRYESVILQLVRTAATGGAATVTGQSFATSDIRDFVTRASRPSSGQQTIGVHLEDGFKGAFSLRSYRPRGMQIVKEVSVYPAAGPSSKVTVTTSGDGCFRLSSPVWQGDEASTAAAVAIDVRR